MYFVQLFTDGGRGTRAWGWREMRVPTRKKGAGVESVVSLRVGGVMLGWKTSAARPFKKPTTTERRKQCSTTTPPEFRGKTRIKTPKNQHGKHPNNHRVQKYMCFLFYKKTGVEQRRKTREIRRFPPFPTLSLSHGNLFFPPDSLSLSIKTLSFSLSLSVSLSVSFSLSRVIKNTGVVFCNVKNKKRKGHSGKAAAATVGKKEEDDGRRRREGRKCSFFSPFLARRRFRLPLSLFLVLSKQWNALRDSSLIVNGTR